jgi:formylglycine-generating enzyme required for sulfatase activity
MGGRDQLNGTVLDCERGARLWQKATGTMANWNGASQYCASLTLVGVPWRLPTLAELRLLSGATGRSNLWIEAPFIQDTHGAMYWSASIDTTSSAKRLVWDYSGTTKWGGEDPSAQHYVRCVSGDVLSDP